MIYTALKIIFNISETLFNVFILHCTVCMNCITLHYLYKWFYFSNVFIPSLYFYLYLYCYCCLSLLLFDQGLANEILLTINTSYFHLNDFHLLPPGGCSGHCMRSRAHLRHQTSTHRGTSATFFMRQIIQAFSALRNISTVQHILGYVYSCSCETYPDMIRQLSLGSCPNCGNIALIANVTHHSNSSLKQIQRQLPIASVELPRNFQNHKTTWGR